MLFMFIYILHERDLNIFIYEKAIPLIVINIAKYDNDDFIMYYIRNTDYICDTYIIIFPILMYVVFTPS